MGGVFGRFNAFNFSKKLINRRVIMLVSARVGRALDEEPSHGRARLTYLVRAFFILTFTASRLPRNSFSSSSSVCLSVRPSITM